ncbi:hypothetical protein SSX86_022499 [Deinandra increscens subsp. villosa]|uniref:TIR domain-containing protein n=1 Tax=Deinandra increscens subsp. villosa TaxID=3103831 RepID=A0AAP0CMW2_9ASTR
MASASSSSTSTKSYKYDVFLSFRGEDTRKNFVDHLYLALVNKGIITYKDDEKIKKGEVISDQLITSIEESRFYIIVFSKNYADSSWCLNELVKIMECQKMKEHTAYPVFYDVEPTEIRNQSGTVGKAFAKHKEKEEAERWREALKEAADIAGWELKNTVDGHEAKFIQKIVRVISLESHFINLSIDGKLVGMVARVKEVVSTLEIDSDGVRMIGIWGMGGGGKTTLARAVFDHIAMRFEGNSFVENVREVSKGAGLKKLQKQVLRDVLNDQSIRVSSVYEGINKMQRMMSSKKVLVALDDVDHVDQLDALVGDLDWFNTGSRIIITTRDKQVLVAHGVHSDNIHDVSLLSSDEAICLFSRYAFRTEFPRQGYGELSREVIRYAAGLPLTIKVLGSFLNGRSEREWKDAIERLKTIPLKETLEKLELSYDGLENDYKEMFLEVACILKGKEEDFAIRVLESFGLNAQIGLRVLEQKSLITISEYNRVQMHDHIVEMGRNIVRRLYPDEPRRHSRLWITEEIEDILVNELGTNATRSILLEYSSLHPTIIMEGLKKMKELRFLYVDMGLSGLANDEEGGGYFPDTLRSLFWPSYPFFCLPKTFQANVLVNLDIMMDVNASRNMPYNPPISGLWEGGEKKVLNKLKVLNLSSSAMRTFDLGLTPNLERLDLEDCQDLVELNIGLTPCLEELILRGCFSLEELHIPVESPKLKIFNIIGSKVTNINLGLTLNLERLNLEDCNDLVELKIGLTPCLEEFILVGCHALEELHMPVESSKLKTFDIIGSTVTNINLGLTPNLERLNLKDCNDLVELNIGLTQCLKELIIEGCYALEELHMLVESPKLKIFNIIGSKVTNINLGLTSNLERLDLKNCMDLVELNIGLTPCLVEFILVGCNALEDLHIPVESSKLKTFDIIGSTVTNINLGLTQNLERLNLEDCYDLVKLNIGETPYLVELNIGLTPCLEELILVGCNALEELHMPVESPKLQIFNIIGSKVTNINLGLTPNLGRLNLEDCIDLVELNMPFECPKLEFLNLGGSKVCKLNIGLTPHLERLELGRCYYLQEIVGCLKTLVFLNLSGGLRFQDLCFDERYNLPGLDSFYNLQMIGEPLDICPLHPNSTLPKFRFKCFYNEPLPSQSGNIEKLISFGLCACTNLESFSATICGLQHLRNLTLEVDIGEALENLYQLESLEELTLSMKDIKHLPDSICMLKHLKYLQLKSCWLLEQLPKDLARLDCLEELHLTDCVSLRDIPNDICMLKCLQRLDLSYCILVTKLSEEFGRLKCLKELNIEGTGISHLPQSIHQLKGLRIIGSRWRLESHGFTSLIEMSKYTAFCYI